MITPTCQQSPTAALFHRRHAAVLASISALLRRGLPLEAESASKCVGFAPLPRSCELRHNTRPDITESAGLFHITQPDPSAYFSDAPIAQIARRKSRGWRHRDRCLRIRAMAVAAVPPPGRGAPAAHVLELPHRGRRPGAHACARGLRSRRERLQCQRHAAARQLPPGAIERPAVDQGEILDAVRWRIKGHSTTRSKTPSSVFRRPAQREPSHPVDSTSSPLRPDDPRAHGAREARGARAEQGDDRRACRA